MLQLGALWCFVAAAAVMVGVAALFVWPSSWPGRGGARPALGAQVSAKRSARWQRAGALMLPVVAGATYVLLGDPGAIGWQRTELSARLRQVETALDEATAREALIELQKHLMRQPDDARAWVLKARLDMQAERFEQASAAYERALQGKSKTAADAGVWVEYAEARGLLQGGALAGQPRQLVDKALALDPEHSQALDLAGSAAWEAGEYPLAVTHWQRLLLQIPAGSPRHLQLSTAIRRAEQRARQTLPAAR